MWWNVVDFVCGKKCGNVKIAYYTFYYIFYYITTFSTKFSTTVRAEEEQQQRKRKQCLTSPTLGRRRAVRLPKIKSMLKAWGKKPSRSILLSSDCRLEGWRQFVHKPAPQ
jgi:hypothetical protein